MDFDDTFPDPKGMIQRLQEERGMNLVIWIANRTANKMLEEGAKAGYVFSPETYTEWPATDVRKPEAYEWFKKHLDAYVSMGVKGYKIDRGEEAEMPDAVQNHLVTLFAKLAKEGLEARHPGDNLVFARNVYDTGRKYTAVWDGDTETTWPGLISSVKHAIRCGAINMPMWGSDVGGYHRGTLTKELFARWLQLGAYSTMMEVKIGGGRTPWIHYDDELIAIARAQAAAHHDLMPYTRSALHQATRTGWPVMRQLLFDFPDDASLYETWDQYMFGPSILVAPVVQDGARTRPVYLPKGRWMDYNDRKTIHDGGTTLTAAAPLDRVPLFVKEGAIITRGEILRSNNAWVPRWRPFVKVEVFAAREGTTTFEYFNGKTVEPIASAIDKGTFTLAFGDLGHAGYVEVFMKAPTGKVVINGKAVTEGDGMTYDAEKRALIFPFSGPTKVSVVGAASLF
jgi:alpha-D-xyloside xylohydrolase